MPNPQTLEATQLSDRVRFFIREIPNSLQEISPSEFLALYSVLTILLTYIGTKALYDLLEHATDFSARQIIIRLIAMFAAVGMPLGILIESLSKLQNKQEELVLMLAFVVFTFGTFAITSLLSLLEHDDAQE